MFVIVPVIASAYIPTELLPALVIIPPVSLVISVPFCRYIPCESLPIIIDFVFNKRAPPPKDVIPAELFPTVMKPSFFNLALFFPINPADKFPIMIVPLFSPSIPGVNPAGVIPVYCPSAIRAAIFISPELAFTDERAFNNIVESFPLISVPSDDR